MIGQKQFGVGIKIGGKISGSLLKSIKVAEAKVSGLGKTMGRSLTNAAAAGRKSFMGLANNDAYRAAAVGAAGIGLALGQALRVSMRFEKSASALQSKLQVASGEMTPLLEMAKQLGSTTKFTASEAVEAMDFLAMAGFKTNEILQVTPGVLKLAAVANMDLAESADIASNILGGMNMKVGETEGLIDLLAKTSVSGNLNLRMLGESFKYVGPVASMAGISVEQMAASMAILGNSGIQASEAGTALRGVILRLSDPPKEAAAALKTLGVATADANGDLKKFPDLLKEIGASLKGVEGSANRAAIIQALFGKLQASGGSTLLRAAEAGKLDEMIKTVSDNQGSAAKMAEEMQNNLAGSLTKLGSAWEGLQLSLMDPKSTGGIKDLVDGLASVISKVTEFSRANPKATSTIVALSAALAALTLAAPFIAAAISVIGSLASGFGVLFGVLSSGTILATTAGWLGALGPILAALTGPIGLTVLAIVGIGLAFKAAYDHVDWFRIRVDKWVSSFRVAWGGLMEFLVGAWDVVVGIFTFDGEKLGKGWETLVKGMKKMWEGWVGMVAAVFGTSIKRVQGIIDVLVGTFTLDIDKLARGWTAFTDGLGPDIDKALAGIGRAFKDWGAKAQKEWESLGKNSGERFVNAFKQAFMSGTPVGWALQGINRLQQRPTSGLTLRSSPSDYGTAPATSNLPATEETSLGASLPATPATTTTTTTAPAVSTVAQALPVAAYIPSAPVGAMNNVSPTAGLLGLKGGIGAAPTAMPPPQPYAGGLGFDAPQQSAMASQSGRIPSVVIEQGAVQVTVGSGDPAQIEQAVARALDQFRYELQSSYRSMLSD